MNSPISSQTNRKDVSCLILYKVYKVNICYCIIAHSLLSLSIEPKVAFQFWRHAACEKIEETDSDRDSLSNISFTLVDFFL